MPESNIGYYYDWEKGFTTDPRFSDKGCPSGSKAVARITVNGVDLKYPGNVRTCHSGPRGFVDHILSPTIARTDGHCGFRSENGELAHEILFGEVEIAFDPNCDYCYPQRKDYRTPNCEDMS